MKKYLFFILFILRPASSIVQTADDRSSTALNYSPRDNQQFILTNSRSKKDGGKNYEHPPIGEEALIAVLRNLLGGVYLQNASGKLGISDALRYRASKYRANGANSPVVGGFRLWGDDRLRVADFFGRIGGGAAGGRNSAMRAINDLATGPKHNSNSTYRRAA